MHSRIETLSRKLNKQSWYRNAWENSALSNGTNLESIRCKLASPASETYADKVCKKKNICANCSPFFGVLHQKRQTWPFPDLICRGASFMIHFHAWNCFLWAYNENQHDRQWVTSNNCYPTTRTFNPLDDKSICLSHVWLWWIDSLFRELSNDVITIIIAQSMLELCYCVTAELVSLSFLFCAWRTCIYPLWASPNSSGQATCYCSLPLMKILRIHQ